MGKEININNSIDGNDLALGSNRKEVLNMGDEKGDVWMPAEVDVYIRPGWFYYEAEDSLVKTPEQLFDIYLNSVGRGVPLLLNVTPNRQGLIPEQDIVSLQGWNEKLDKTFETNLAASAKVEVGSYRGKSNQFAATNLTDGNKETYRATDDEVKTGTITLTFKEPTLLKYILIQEYIKLGQLVKLFSVEVFKNGQWKRLHKEQLLDLNVS